ncbi:MAG: phenylalanine 4-monooxygenase [Flammeovirgaceae bacterium]|nr:phenylalanine 4-monooxygenase [Flammeovirgaceae bacterium]
MRQGTLSIIFAHLNYNNTLVFLRTNLTTMSVSLKFPQTLPHMKQMYEQYTSEDFTVWKLLYERQMTQLPLLASEAFLSGLKKVNFVADRIPNFEETNLLLRDLTGWETYVVPGLIPNREFFELLLNKKFPATTWLRKMSQLDYLEEPDMFHDVFGHIPLLSDTDFCNFLKGFSEIALKYIENEWAIELISRLYWYTVEFGLIQENGQLKIYGAGILSSKGESSYCVGDIPKRVPYNIREIVATPYIKDRYQSKYFVITSYKELYESLDEIRQVIDEAVNSPVVASSTKR